MRYTGRRTSQVAVVHCRPNRLWYATTQYKQAVNEKSAQRPTYLYVRSYKPASLGTIEHITSIVATQRVLYTSPKRYVLLTLKILFKKLSYPLFNPVVNRIVV